MKKTVRSVGSEKYVYQIFSLAGEPQVFHSDSHGYTSPQEARRAGYEFIAGLKKRSKKKNQRSPVSTNSQS
jgi:hypothetical protein